ncbi:MAG: dienelactone hydrolase family protein [Planctomycetaceae bacterium]|nr:dienelactone hydrolase family protein [Planctomycetaceae bacterium]
MIAAAFILTVALFVASSDSDVAKLIDLCESREYRYTGGDYKDHVFRYRLFVPRHLDPTKRYPILVWLHGSSERGTDNRGSARRGVLALGDPEHIEECRFFLLSTQAPKNSGWTFGPGGMLSVTLEILQKTMRECPIDPNRVYLSGVSFGGSGCWTMAAEHPELFAAIAPMAGRGGGMLPTDKLTKIPIWVFHNQDDVGLPPSSVQRTVAALQEAGCNVELALLPQAGHDCWTAAFQEYGVMPWLLEQRRDASVCWTPPGCRPWRWWHLLILPCAVLIFVRCAWHFKQHRHKASPAAMPPEHETAEMDFFIGPASPECEDPSKQ